MKCNSNSGARYVRGIDVSEYQPDIDWSKVAASGVSFCFVRASHGLHVDAVFAEHRKGAKSAGIARGFYHYFVPRQSLDDQIQVFVSAVGKLERGDLPPVLDIENPAGWSSVARNKRLALVTGWLSAVAKLLGVKPLIYCSLNFVSQALDDPDVDTSELGKYPLWIAEWHVQPGQQPALPAPWSSWTFWQYSDHIAVPGIDPVAVDGDVFNGTTERLRRLKSRLKVGRRGEVPGRR